ncbi:MAG: phenylalanine--tRNA ligase subunit beta [Candidatus Woesearchaeota archaeon]
MPTITLDRKEFNRLLGKAIPEEKLKDRISMLGTDLESIDSEKIVVEIFPNRPDMLSMQGFVRALKSFVGITKGLAKFEVKKSNEKIIIDGSVCKVRPYTACAIVKGLELNDQKIKDIIQIQEKLHITFGRDRKKAAIGIYPIEKIKFPIKFLAKKPEEIKFRPLDSDKEMNASEILRKHPAGKEHGHLLDGNTSFPVFVDSNNNILSMPPIINSELTGRVCEKTKNIFIECSGFDFNTLELCLSMIVTALSDMGGQIYSVDLEYPKKADNKTTPDLGPKKWEINIDNINKLLGLNLKEKDMKELLEKMGFGYDKKTVFVPAYRADIMHEVDFAEDIAIAYGYENFNEEIPDTNTIAEESAIESFKNKIAEILTGAGLLELNTYNLTNKENQTLKMKLDKMEVVEMKNSVSKEYNTLRAWLIPCLLETLKNNKQHEYPHRIFDMGAVFVKDRKEETGVREDQHLAVAIAQQDADFTKIKQILDYLMRMIDAEYKTMETRNPSFLAGRAASVVCNSKEIGFLGEISPEVLENWNLDMPVSVFEIDISGLMK